MTQKAEIKRFFYHRLSQRLREELGFMQVLAGPRQVGKTTCVEQLARDWVGSKIVVSADEVTPPNSEWIEFHWQRARELPSPCFLAIDEIQKIPGWSDRVKVLFDRDRKSRRLRVVLSGSASLSLQRGLSDSLAGRYELIRCPHWTLKEMQQAFDWKMTDFLKFGGYPAAVPLISDLPRWRSFVRDSIIEPVLTRDLQAVIPIQKPALLRQLLALCLVYPAQEISYQKLLHQLQDKGNAATIKSYLEILEGAFMIKKLEKYSGSRVRQKGSSPKIIPMAPSLIHAFSDPNELERDPDWRGRVFEAAIGAHLSLSNENLFYWREGNLEVDYVLQHGRNIIAIEVKSGRKKKSAGLRAFKKKYPKAKVLTLDQNNVGEIFETTTSEEIVSKLLESSPVGIASS